MADLKDITAVSIKSKDVSLHEILYYLKIDDKMDFLWDTIADILISQAGEREGITTSDEELQNALDIFRQDKGLYKKMEMEEWLKQKDMIIEDLETHLERPIIKDKLKEKITAGKAEQYFAENRLSFDAAEISHILIEKEGIAHELFTQITEEEIAFSVIARKHSIDKDSKEEGGYIGFVNRKDMSSTMESAVFGAKEGDIVGPVKTDMGFHIIKVEKIHIGELDDNTRSSIKDELFSIWLKEEIRNAGIDLKLTALI